MTSSVDAAVATFERNIAATTGRTVPAWVELVGSEGLVKHGAIVAWLKGEHGLGHAHANQIAKRATAAPQSADDPAAHLFAGKEAVRPIYDALVAAATALGPDVEVAPKKANVSLRRRKQFALIQPSTRTRVDLGLILAGRAPDGRLEASGSFNAMFTHRIKIASVAEVDATVCDWLAAAYAEAG